jgi:hypothetical protein
VANGAHEKLFEVFVVRGCQSVGTFGIRAALFSLAGQSCQFKQFFKKQFYHVAALIFLL